MDEEKNEEIKEENQEDNSDDVREEETSEEIRDETYVNDDEIEMLNSIEKRFNILEEKLDNAISMFVDSGAIIQERIDDKTSDELDEDFVSIDDLNLTL